MTNVKKWGLISVIYVGFLSLFAAMAPALSDNSIFTRAWARTYPNAKPLVEQNIGTQLGAKQFGENVLWAQANPEPVTPPASTGWTLFPPAADARIVYVSSSSGNDGSDGSQAHPRRTLQIAKQSLRQGFPDRVLLKRGDVFDETLVRWDSSGRSADQPALLGAYGDGARPVIRGGLTTFGNDLLHDVAIMGIDFEGCGIQWRQPGSNVLVEDCRIIGGEDGLDFNVLGSGGQDFRFRRLVVMDTSTTGSGHVQGAYLAGMHGLLLEECVFDNDGKPGDIFRHACYVQNFNTGVVVRGCVFSNAGSHGMQLRCGGEVIDCLFLRNPISLSVGGGNNVEPGGVLASVTRCVFLGGGDIEAAPPLGGPRGWGPGFMNIRSGHVWRNVIADGTGGFMFPFSIGGNFQDDAGIGFGVHDLVVEGNVRRGWPCSDHPDKVAPGYLLQGTPAQRSGTTVSGLEERTDLVGVDLSLDAYMPNFLGRARERAAGEWDAAASAAGYTAWALARVGL